MGGKCGERLPSGSKSIDVELIMSILSYPKPLENQIFFGRPSPELALKMLRDAGAESLRGKIHWETPPSLDDDVAVLKEYVTTCLEKTTETLEEELSSDPFSCIWHGSEMEECYFE